MARTTMLTAAPCPFCGGPPAAARIPQTTPKSPKNGVAIGCGSPDKCVAIILVRGTSFGDAIMNWNMLHHLDHIGIGNAYRLSAPQKDISTIGTLV